MIEYLDLDDYKFMHLVVPEPFEDAQQWNGKNYQCCFCGRVHRRRSGCQNCVACGEDSSTCECDDCRYCKKLPNLCGCKLCRSCGYPEEHTPQTLANPRLLLCHCKHCKHCGKRRHECQCNGCLDCNHPGSHCRCMYCPVCKRKVKHCDCETCPLCEVKWERCNCFWHGDRKVKLDHSRLLQVIDTKGLESRYLPEEPRFVETVHIRAASLHDYRIIAVKKIRPYLARCFSRRLDNIRYRYRQAKGCITGSAVYKLLQPQYKQLAFYFEVSHQFSFGPRC